MQGLEGAGADVLEIGVPFSDPMADGPAIQAAGLRALKAGQTLAKTIEMARDFRAGDADTPIVRWDNPFLRAAPGTSPQWHDDEIGVAGCIQSLVDALRNNAEPSYGALQGRLDQELILAIRQSSAAGGQVVELTRIEKGSITTELDRQMS